MIRTSLTAGAVLLALCGVASAAENAALKKCMDGANTTADMVSCNAKATKVQDDCLNRAVAANPAERFETAEEWLLLFERGEREAISSRPRPLLEREPLAVWRGLALLSLLANLVLLVLLMQG